MHKPLLINQLKALLSPELTSGSNPHFNVQWMVYHVPKTAGTSLRNSFERCYGKRNIYAVYRSTGANKLSKGESIWVPNSAKVIFGHVCTHSTHSVMFPSAKKITWVRDPLERCWSLFNHFISIRHKNPKFSARLTKYPEIEQGNVEKAFERMIKEDTYSPMVSIYSRYFDQVSLKEFDFVGCTNRNSADLIKLQDMLGKPLPETHKNKRNSVKSLPDSLRSLSHYLDHEYEIVGDFL